MRTLVNGGPAVVIITPGFGFVLDAAQRTCDMQRAENCNRGKEDTRSIGPKVTPLAKCIPNDANMRQTVATVDRTKSINVCRFMGLETCVRTVPALLETTAAHPAV